MHPDLLSAVPGLRQAREAEYFARACAFAGLRRRVCGMNLQALQPRHRLALALMGNAFLAHREPSPDDVAEFLFVLHPSCDLPAGSLRRIWFKWRIGRLARRLPIEEAARQIWKYLGDMMQDAETGGESPDMPDYSQAVHWIAAEAGRWLRHGGFTLETFLRTPYPILIQLDRAAAIAAPPIRYADGRAVVEWPRFTNGSDRLVASFHRAHREEIKRAILNPENDQN